MALVLLGGGIATALALHKSGGQDVPVCMRPSERFLPGSPDGGVVSSTWRDRRLATVGPSEHCAVSDGLGLWFGSKSLRRVAGNPRETGVSHAQVESPRMPRMTQARPPRAAAFAVTMIHTTRVMLWS